MIMIGILIVGTLIAGLFLGMKFSTLGKELENMSCPNCGAIFTQAGLESGAWKSEGGRWVHVCPDGSTVDANTSDSDLDPVLEQAPETLETQPLVHPKFTSREYEDPQPEPQPKRKSRLKLTKSVELPTFSSSVEDQDGIVLKTSNSNETQSIEFILDENTHFSVTIDDLIEAMMALRD